MQRITNSAGTTTALGDAEALGLLSEGRSWGWLRDQRSQAGSASGDLRWSPWPSPRVLHDPHRHHRPAFEVIVATMLLGSAGHEAGTASGEVRIWLAADVVNKLRALREPGESYGDVMILRIAKAML